MTEDQRQVLHKEIDLIESAIERMARNSFMIKGWALSLTALVATLSSLPIWTTALIVLFPIVGFWWLDSFYLRLERAFRKVYEDRIAKRTAGNWTDDLYVINCGRFFLKVQSLGRIMFSSSTLPFYGTIIVLLLVVICSQIDWRGILHGMSHLCCCLYGLLCKANAC